MLKQLALSLVVLTSFMTTGCAGSSNGGSEGSRHTLYESIEDLAADSSLVVEATVTSVGPAVDKPYSLTPVSATVVQNLHPEGLASKAEAATEVTILQLGSLDQPGAAPIVERGGHYLLFLTASGLPDFESSFFVTGGTAGLWELQGSEFVRLADEGDELPASISSETVADWTRSD